MFDTIFIGTSGLLNHAKGLRVVGNNLANVNTAGFKSSQLQFSNLFEQSGGGQYSGGPGSGTGTGMNSLGANISFRAGLDQTTGNPLDLNVNGNGFFAVKRDDQVLYTRSGDFRFDAKGILVNALGDRVQALDASGQLTDITAAGFERSAPKATTTVKFKGDLTNTPAPAGSPPVSTGVNGITVIDATGVGRPLKLSIANDGGGSYTVNVLDEANTNLGSGVIKFAGEAPVAGSDSVTFKFAPAGTPEISVKLDFSKDVRSVVTTSNLEFVSQDGYSAGVKTDQIIDAEGHLVFQYSNGQTVKGQRLALADFQSEQSLAEAGGAAFKLTAGSTVQYGHAGADSFGRMVGGHREGSNVDLAEEFGNLILMQRGYQAASHVVSTANDMIQQLFDMKGR